MTAGDVVCTRVYEREWGNSFTVILSYYTPVLCLMHGLHLLALFSPLPVSSCSNRAPHREFFSLHECTAVSKSFFKMSINCFIWIHCLMNPCQTLILNVASSLRLPIPSCPSAYHFTSLSNSNSPDYSAPYAPPSFHLQSSTLSSVCSLSS